MPSKEKNMKLYAAEPSGNAYKVKILLALLKVPYETVLLDFSKQEHKQASFLKLNPRGEVPVIEDGGKVVWDSAACLVYVARKYGGEQWFPAEPAAMAEITQWLALSATEIQIGLQYTRRGLRTGRWTAGNLEQGQAIGRIALGTMENRLKNHDWLALDRPTIAEPACFPYVETAPESGLPLTDYPAVAAWIARCKALPGWPAR
jgi:glutathione S-transferase